MSRLAGLDARPEVRRAYIGENKPASTLIGIGDFAIPGMLIEIEAIAVAKRRGAARRGRRTARRPRR